MLRVSSIFKPNLRRWIALAGVGCVLMVLWLVALEWQRRAKVPTTLLLVAAPLVAGVSSQLRHALRTGMVDEAWIEGEELLMGSEGQSVRMSLANIASVEITPGALVVLQWSMPCALGPRIRFIAAKSSSGDLQAQLRRRVDDARRRAA